MKPVLASMAERYEGRVIFLDYQWDTEFGGAAAADMGVRGHPTYIVLNAYGNEVDRLFGFHSEQEVAAVLDEALAAD